MRAAVLVVLILIAIASVAVIGIWASQIYSLATSLEDGFDLSEASIKVTGTGSFSNVAIFLPLAQAFTGTNFSLKGITLSPQPDSVSTLRIDFDLPPTTLENGWAFTQAYEYENASAVLIEDEEGNKIAIAAAEMDNPAQFLSDIEDQYSDMLPLFGFEVISSTVEANRMETLLRQGEGDLTIKARAGIDPQRSNRVYVAVLSTSGEPSADFDTIVNLLLG